MSAAPDTTGSGLVLRIYMGLFFAYMFLPLILMVAAGFNAYSPPSVTVWQGFTLHWFAALWSDTRMWSGLRNSILIAAAVIALSLPMGLAGALLLGRLSERSAGLLYAAMVSPLLTPGIVLGVSTVIFWRNFDVAGGLFTAIVAQTTFIAAYAMLMVTARLQRQDASLEEAARDLGATPFQAFRRITLPFLRPTLVSAGALNSSREGPQAPSFRSGRDRKAVGLPRQGWAGGRSLPVSGHAPETSRVSTRGRESG